MTIKLCKTALALAALMCLGVAKGQGPSDGKVLVLDLPTALEIALSTNPTIKSAELEIERFDWVRRETMGNHLPQLSVGGQYEFTLVKREMAKGMSFGADMGATAAANLTIPLFAPGVYAGLKLGRTQQALAVEQARGSRIEMANAVKKSFYQILLLEKSYAVLLSSAETVGETVENARTMFRSGLASEYDLLTAEVQLSNLQPTIITTANAISLAGQMLKMYLGIPESVEIKVSGSLDDFRSEVFTTLEGESSLEGNTELRQLDFQKTLLAQQIRMTNTQRMPTLAAYGSYQISGQDKMISFGMTGMQETAKWWWQRPATAGFQFSIPIFAGLKNSSKVRQLRNSQAQLELQRSYLTEAKRLESRTAASNVVTAREKMTANEKTVAQAEKAFSISRTRFDAGAGTMLEVNQAQLNLTQSRLNLSQAIYDLLAAKADYDKVAGKEE